MCNYIYYHTMPRKTMTASDFGGACVCLGLRKAARLVARRYDDALRPLAITSGQFSILAALLRDGAVAMGGLAEALGMDRTTLNRNLKPLERGRLIASSTDRDDRRVRAIQLTEAGHAMLSRAIPIWERAQADSQTRLAGLGWTELQTRLRALS